MPARKSVLFICTGNSCRSQMAEAILRHIAGDRLKALSAGSRPAGFVHPLARQALKDLGISTDGLVSKHWSEIMDRRIDICITLCDNASAECPTWPSGTIQAHWSLPDPSFYDGTPEQRQAFCQQIADRLQTRLTRLAELVARDATPQALAQALVQLAST